jgi:hypothetical protein
MAFPLSITGKVTVSDDQVPASLKPLERLHAALRAETVDRLEQTGNCLTFAHRQGIHASVPRPGGQWWMFAMIDRGQFEVARNLGAMTVRYELSTRVGFFLMTTFALAVGTLIQSSSGPGHEWGWVFGCGLWLLMFVSSYASKAIEIRRWIKKVMTSDSLPPSAELHIDEP